MSFQKRLSSTLLFIAKMVGKCSGLTMGFGGRQAFYDFDSRHINLPVLPDNDEAARDLAIGFAIHEAGHHAYSQPGPYARAGNGTHLHDLVNIVDDVQQERQAIRDWPGAGHALKRTVGRMVTDGRFGAVDGAQTAAFIKNYVLMYLRHRVLGQPCGEIAENAIETFRDVYGSAMEKEFRALLDREMLTVWSTEAAFSLAQMILEYFDDKQGDSSNSDSTDDSNDDDSGDSSSSDSADDSNDDSGDSSNSGRNPLAGVSEGDDKVDLGQLVAGELEEISSKTGDRDVAVVMMPKAIDTPSRNRNELDITLASSHALRGTFVNLVESARRKPKERSVRGSRFDMPNIWRHRIGDDKLRVKKQYAPDVNTAVWLLLDASGSMLPRMPLARQAILAASIALETIDGTKVGAACFPLHKHGDSSYPGRIGVMLNPGERARHNASRFLVPATGKNTPLAPALWWVGSQIAAMEEPRKMILVATDGAPDSIEQSKYVIDKLGEVGVEVYGLAIGEAAAQPVARLFDRFGVVRNIADLPKAVFRMLKDSYLNAA